MREFCRFLKKILVLFSPVFLLIVFYVVSDPFKVIRSYQQYYRSGGPNYVFLNKDYVSTETFIRNYPRYKYDSFIFGNSRSIFYLVEDWRLHINSDRCFHFDASGESLYGIVRKFEFLRKRGVIIKNALIIMDAQLLSETTNSSGHLFIKHPALSGQSRWAFQRYFFQAFISKGFFVSYAALKFSPRNKPHIDPDVMETRPIDYDSMKNEITFSYYENMIARNPDEYYRPRINQFKKRDPLPAVSPPMIGNNQRELLMEISEILRRDEADYRLVISPLYDQINLNPSDELYLCELFGRDKVFNFSGINEITKDYTNYYDYSHYRPHVTRTIMKIIYEKR